MCQPITSETRRRPRAVRSIQPPLNAALWRRMETVVAFTFAVPLDELRAASRARADAACARQVVMYMARVVLGLPWATVSRLCRRDRKTIAHACAVIEQRRDDPAFNRVLHLLEQLCRLITVGHGESSEVRS